MICILNLVHNEVSVILNPILNIGAINRIPTFDVDHDACQWNIILTVLM
jgi:hypothetical protein